MIKGQFFNMVQQYTKRFALVTMLMLFSLNIFSQSKIDSLWAVFKEFHLSAEAGYNYLLPSAAEFHQQSDLVDFHYAIGNPDSKYFQHHQWNVAVAAENNAVKWRLALERDYLGYEYYGATFDADYFRTALSLQFFILNKRSLQILIGPSLELGWITNYDYSKDGITMHNPNIGQTCGINLLFPMTVLFPVAKHSRIYVNIAGGVHLRDDHEIPYFDRWGRHGYRPEAELRSYCPFSIGLGYGFTF